MKEEKCFINKLDLILNDLLYIVYIKKNKYWIIYVMVSYKIYMKYLANNINKQRGIKNK